MLSMWVSMCMEKMSSLHYSLSHKQFCAPYEWIYRISFDVFVSFSGRAVLCGFMPLLMTSHLDHFACLLIALRIARMKRGASKFSPFDGYIYWDSCDSLDVHVCWLYSKEQTTIFHENNLFYTSAFRLLWHLRLFLIHRLITISFHFANRSSIRLKFHWLWSVCHCSFRLFSPWPAPWAFGLTLYID